ncbi:MAG: hypothetical protein N3G20_05325 [Verrucomicrobiae bacterium]|nr:hypothetical protein [Verrucomicrobiae bacterium]
MNVRFGPEAYATNAMGGIAFYPETKRHAMAGTGQWIRRSWVVPAVNLKGINVGAFTGGPRFVSENGQVCVSRVEMAVLRVRTHPLAGRDPLAGCYEDPKYAPIVTGAMLSLIWVKASGMDSTWRRAVATRR